MDLRNLIHSFCSSWANSVRDVGGGGDTFTCMRKLVRLECESGISGKVPRRQGAAGESFKEEGTDVLGKKIYRCE